MDTQPLVNALAILRLVRSGGESITARKLIHQLVGAQTSASIELKVAAYMIDQLDLARSVIENSKLSVEARAGIDKTLAGLQSAFELRGMSNGVYQHVPDPASAISNFVILLSFAGVDERGTPEEANDLAQDVDDAIKSFFAADIDPLARDIAVKHLTALATLLRHIPIFGLEAAMSTYFELMARLRRAEAGASPESRAASSPIWETLKSWGERFDAIDKVWNVGARALEHAPKA